MASSIGEKIQSADWKKEKHVPAITTVDSAKAGDWIKVNVRVGKEVEHPTLLSTTSYGYRSTIRQRTASSHMTLGGLHSTVTVKVSL